MELTLSTQEERLLEEVLEEKHLSLQREISHTDHRECKQTLRNNEKLIESMLGHLRVAVVSKAS